MCIHVCVYIYVCVCVLCRNYIYLYLYMSIYIFIYIYIVCIYIYIYKRPEWAHLAVGFKLRPTARHSQLGAPSDVDAQVMRQIVQLEAGGVRSQNMGQIDSQSYPLVNSHITMENTIAMI